MGQSPHNLVYFFKVCKVIMIFITLYCGKSVITD